MIFVYVKSLRGPSFARAHHLSPAYVSRAFNGFGKPGKKLLIAMGWSHYRMVSERKP